MKSCRASHYFRRSLAVPTTSGAPPHDQRPRLLYPLLRGILRAADRALLERTPGSVENPSLSGA